MTKKELVEFLAPYPDDMKLWREQPFNDEPVTMEEVVWWNEDKRPSQTQTYSILRDCAHYKYADKSCVKGIMLK